MATSIDRHDVRRLLAEGATLVDVLPEGEYAEEHIAGAINLPLAALTRDTAGSLRPGDPVIVYCFDAE